MRENLARLPDRESASHRDDKIELKVWLRLLTCTSLIEAEVRSRLRSSFDTTLPRFDLLAQLDRAGDGLTMGELGSRLMVTGGRARRARPPCARPPQPRHPPHRQGTARLRQDGAGA